MGKVIESRLLDFLKAGIILGLGDEMILTIKYVDYLALSAEMEDYDTTENVERFGPVELSGHKLKIDAMYTYLGKTIMLKVIK